MKKRLLFQLLLLLLPAFVLPAVASAFPHEHKNPTGNEASCPAPPPSWLIVTEITSDHVSLEWESGQVYRYYRVQTYDNTAGVPLADEFTDDNTITINNLTPTHCYTFTVSATYCPEAPEWGAGISSEECCIPSIIIDGIVQIQEPCTIGSGDSTSYGQVYTFCAGRSTAGKNEPLNKAFIGRIIDGSNNTVDFAFAFNGLDIPAGETEESQLYYFDYPYFDDLSIAELYKVKEGPDDVVFRISSLNTTYVDLALFNVEFFGSYNFAYCHDCQLPGVGGLRLLPTNEATDLPTTQISPNPFSHSTTLRYALTEPGPVEISLYDAMGRLVKVVQKTTLQEAGNYETTVDGAGLPDGVYFLHTMTGHTRQVFSLVKQE